MIAGFGRADWLDGRRGGGLDGCVSATWEAGHGRARLGRRTGHVSRAQTQQMVWLPRGGALWVGQRDNRLPFAVI